MAALLTDIPDRPFQHRSELIAKNTVRAANNVVSHVEPSVLFVPLVISRRSIRQFDPVGMLFIPLVFLSKDLFEPIRLTVSDRPIRERGRMKDDEVLQACVAAQDPHCLKTSSRLLARLVFPYCHCFHVLNFSASADLIGDLAAGQPTSPTPPQFNLATTMSKVQNTPTRTNAMNPIRIHCSGVKCIQLISVLALPSAAWPLAFVASPAMGSSQPLKHSFSKAMC